MIYTEIQKVEVKKSWIERKKKERTIERGIQWEREREREREKKRGGRNRKKERERESGEWIVR